MMAVPAVVETLRAQYVQNARLHGDGEHASAAVFLGFEPIAGQDRFTRHVDGLGVDWPAVLKEEWSSTQRFLVVTAWALWSGNKADADMSRIGYLDDDQAEVFLAMVNARLTGYVPAG